MKTEKNIYKRIKEKEHIKKVITESLSGKKYCERFVKKIDLMTENISGLMEIKDFTLKPTGHRIIHERHKTRQIITCPYYPNKIFDYLIVSGLKKPIEQSMYRWCVGNVKERGKDMGVNYIKGHIENYKYALKLDIKKYYENIDKQILFELIKKKIGDEQFLHMYQNIIGDTGKGLELGLNSSQWLANYYLQDLDYLIKQVLKADVYIRYVDDIIIMGNNKRKLHFILREIKRYLKEELNLELKGNYQLLNLDKEYIDFLGYRVGKENVMLRRSIFYRFVRLYKRMEDYSPKRARTVIALNGWFKALDNSKEYYEKYLEKIIDFQCIIKIGKGELKHELAT